jgi:hypothetical protein
VLAASVVEGRYRREPAAGMLASRRTAMGIDEALTTVLGLR